MKTCLYVPCGKEFEPKKDWQRYCSAQCRNAYHAQERSRLVKVGKAQEVKP